MLSDKEKQDGIERLCSEQERIRSRRRVLIEKLAKPADILADGVIAYMFHRNDNGKFEIYGKIVDAKNRRSVSVFLNENGAFIQKEDFEKFYSTL